MAARPLLRTFAVLAGLAAAWPASARAQANIEAYLGRPVASVKLQIEAREETSDQLRALIDVRPGQPLTVEDLRSTTSHFLSLSRFEDVRVLAAETASGLEITFRLVPVHPIERVQFMGETGLPIPELERLFLQRYGGLLPARERPTDIEDVVRDILADEGFRNAAVTAETVPSHEPERATLLVVVKAGSQATIRQATVSGTSPMSESEIIGRAGAATGQPYRQRAMQTALASIRDDLRGLSYYAAVASHTPRFDGDDVDVTLFVDAGPRVRVVVQPAGAVSPGEVSQLIKQEGSIDEDLLEDTDRTVETRLRQEGYWKADLSHRTEDVDGVRVITFTVERGLRYRISAIDWSTGVKLPRAVIDKLLDARPGQWFDQNRVETGLSRIKDEYERLGFYGVEFKPVYEEVPGAGPEEAGVIVHPNPTEGPQGRIVDVRFVFASGPRVPESEVRTAMRSHKGQPFVVATVRADLDAISELYANRGFRSATIDIKPEFAADGREVALVVSINEGPQILVGEITVIGNNHIRREVILQEITLRPGMPLGTKAVEESANQLRLMGVFSRVRIQEEPRLAGETVSNLVVLVEESPDTTLGGGGGLEVQSLSRERPDGVFEDYLDLSPRAFFEIGRRNLGGRNRSINFFSRISFNARDDNVDDPRGLGFGEYRVTGTFRERRAFRTDTDLLAGITAEQARRATFSFIRQTLNGEALRRLSPAISVAGRYSLEFTELLNERIPEADRPLIDRAFPQVRLSILSSGIQWDRRDNPIAPARGSLLTGDVEFALRGIGSEVGYAKTFLQASRFQSLSSNRRHIFAGRAQLGLARGFERQAQRLDADGQPVIGPDGQPIFDTVADLPASQRFYAGGSTSVRGYQLDRLGVSEILTPDGLSTGGNGLVVFNAELRTRVWEDTSSRLPFVDDLGLVGFLDAGNVFKNASDISLPDLRAAAGFGVRLGSALGPIRLDFGFKLRPRIIGTAGQREKGWEYHLSIGEAF
jgi:outer membrane protein assembly factor BamA